MGDLAQGMDPGIGPTSAAQVQEPQAGVVDDMLDASRHSPDALLRLLGALFLPALEPAPVILDQQPEGGQGCRFHGHGQDPMTAFTAAIRLAGS